MTDFQAHPDPLASGESGTAPEVTLQSGMLEQPGETVGEPEWPAEAPDGAGHPGSASATLVACTIATRTQLPAARVLRDSFLRRHSGARFVLLLVDRPDAADPQDGVVITPHDVGVDAEEFGRLAVGCTAEQFRAVLCPRLLTRLLESGSTVLYLEPSVQVFGAFDDLLQALSPQRPVALFPRVLRPLGVHRLRPSAADLAESGTFDTSAFAVCPGAEQFLASWAEQVRADPGGAALFLDGTPGLVDHEVVRDPGVGLSAWNAAQRELIVSDDGQYTVDGVALRSVHFTGFQPQRPWLLSAAYADRPRVLLSENPVLAGLCAAYRNALVGAGYTREQPHAFDTLTDGTVLPTALRGEYLHEWLHAEQAGQPIPPSPFGPDDDAQKSFLDWACEPANDHQRLAGGSRWTAAVWSEDPHLRQDYPDPFGADAESFREWCAGVGVASGRVPAAAVGRKAEAQRSAMVDQLGVGVLGSGRVAELVRTAVRASGLPSADTPYYPVVLRCDVDVAVPAGRHVIDLRPEAALSSEDNDAAETWVLSEASCQVVRRGARTARVVALPLPDRGRVDLPTRKGARARHDLSDEFVIGSFVDHSGERQDNVLGLVSAFVAAFPEREDVRLLIGVTAAAEHPEEAERLRLATVSDPRIVLIEEDTERTVLGAADCVASLHRAEGGAGADSHALRLLDIAARGIPVVASDHGAVAELLGSAGAKLVRCQVAGEPDIDAAAMMLRAAADDPEGVTEFGLAARDHLLAEHSVAKASESLRDRVEQAYRSWRAKWSKDRHGQLDDPLHPLLVARHALHRPPDVDAGSRHAMTPALRKAVLKALGHYDSHIRDVMRSMVDGVEQTAAELLRRQHTGDELDTDSVRAELSQLSQRQERLDAQLAGADDGMVSVRADLAEQHRKLREFDETLVAERSGRDEQIDAMAQRLDRLTSAVERTLDRIDSLEKNQTRDPELESGLRTAAHDAAYALQRTDVLQRILLREHERNTGTEDATSTPVLCDAGLLRLPPGDSMMLPWLSSHASWDAEVSALIDSLLEPDGVFVDVGAYVGYQTVRVLSRLGTSGAVVAVEPSEHGQELLRRNVEVNMPSTGGYRLTVLNSAAWDSQCELAVRPCLAGGLAVAPKPEASEEDEEAETPVVQAVRLDKELENHADLEGLTLSVVHVDVGACVHRVLGGLVRLLRRDRPSII